MNAVFEIHPTNPDKRQDMTVVPQCIYLLGGPCAIYCFTDLDAPLLEMGTIGTEPTAIWAARGWSTDGVIHGLAVVGTTQLSGLIAF